MTNGLLCVLATIGLGLIYVLIDCARSLRNSRDINQHMSDMLERELVRQSLLIEAGVSAKQLEGSAALRLERLRMGHFRFGGKPLGVRFKANIRSQSIAGFGIWVYRDGSWRLEENQCCDGFEPGAPPEFTGRFPGDRIRKEGVARRPSS